MDMHAHIHTHKKKTHTHTHKKKKNARAHTHTHAHTQTVTHTHTHTHTHCIQIIYMHVYSVYTPCTYTRDYTLIKLFAFKLSLRQRPTDRTWPRLCGVSKFKHRNCNICERPPTQNKRSFGRSVVAEGSTQTQTALLQ